MELGAPVRFEASRESEKGQRVGGGRGREAGLIGG